MLPAGVAWSAVEYRAKLKAPDALRPFLDHVEPGRDAFPEEREAALLGARLQELSERLRKDPRSDVGFLLAPGFRGAAGRAAPGVAVLRHPSLEIDRAEGAAPANLDALLQGFSRIDTAEFLITALDVGLSAGQARTDVRFDIVGPGKQAFRVEQQGQWRLGWRKDAGVWRVTEWASLRSVRTSAARPVFAEVTAKALAGNESFRRQLTSGLDAWVAAIDSGLMRDSNGHHGVSAGDADGDGLDDLYVAQPSGLPNRLYRAKGDGTFEDVSEASGLAVLDDTSQSLFADVDNDGDQDLVLVLPAGPALFVNDGKARFARRDGAFRFQETLRGTPMSIAMADYDKDGFLDLYLCVYSFQYGAGEGKAGTPMPYHDAQNGPPSVLFRNDGKGGFGDVTREAGLEATNDRYHFAAAWGDHDDDGWPDLVVANDFGRKNLYRNLGRKDGRVTFEDVSRQAGLEDHGAGMSAALFDYDNDGRLDVYFGNMWSDAGQRVTASARFMPEAPAEVREQYRRHARGNSLFRNLGGGRFEDVTVQAGAEFGRWAWSSDALDFDLDGFEDLYVVNGMLTRASGPQDLDGFFWRQVVARSPLQRVHGTPYDDAWRAINQLLIRGSIASHQRNVFLRNAGQGRFDDVSGALSLDLDQDGRAFSVFDADGDGDPDLAVMAARNQPQLRLFRNDFPGGRALLIRLAGTASNRDAVGAKVTVETDRLRRTKVVQAGSGFLSQHSKELVFGLGGSQRVVRVVVDWPSGRRQELSGIALGQRVFVQEGGAPRSEPLRASGALPADAAPLPVVAPPASVWLHEPFPLPDVAATRALPRGRPSVIVLWNADSGQPNVGKDAHAIALDASPAGEEAGKSFAMLYRHLFMSRQPLPLPAAFLFDGGAGIVKVYRGPMDSAEIARDLPRAVATPAERLARAVPFPGEFHSEPGMRNYLPYGRELLDQDLPGPAVAAFERAAQGNPTASTLYQLGTLLAKSGKSDLAQAAFLRALALQPDLSEANNDLGALLAERGDVSGAIERFRAALVAAPDYPDALNNLGYALLLTGRAGEARALYERALVLQPDFPEALNNLGLILGREGELQQAEPYFRRALQGKPDYAEAANNLALILVARGQTDAAVRLLEEFLLAQPQFDGVYLSLAKIHLQAGRHEEGVAVLERLLQKSPDNAQARALLRQFQGR
jgi:Flp pilus assembly protein TadD